MPHQALLDRVWGGAYGATTHDLRVAISRLRTKMSRPGSVAHIVNERGLGYRFVAQPSAEHTPRRHLSDLSHD